MGTYPDSIWLEAMQECRSGGRVLDRTTSELFERIFELLLSDSVGTDWSRVAGHQYIPYSKEGPSGVWAACAKAGIELDETVAVFGDDGEASTVIEIARSDLESVVDHVHGNLADHVMVTDRACELRFLVEIYPIGSAYIWSGTKIS